MPLETIGMCLGAAATTALAYRMFMEPRRLDVTRRTLYLPELPEGFEGVRILHLSDFHFRGSELRPPQFFRDLEAIECDLLLLTGDFVENDAGIRRAAELMSRLTAPLGKFGVFGNHDFFLYSIRDVLKSRAMTRSAIDVNRLRKELSEAGVRILEDSAAPVERNGQRFWVCGLKDPVTQIYSFRKALQGVPAEEFRLLLAHSPDALFHPVPSRVDLTLCGHTHGGQVRIPGAGELLTHSFLARGYAAGAMKINGIPTYISRGLGVSGLAPIRLRCLPEAALIELRRGEMDWTNARAKRWFITWKRPARIEDPVPATE